jgi:hypothetical protein
MPAWLIRLLPHALVVAAVLGALGWIDHRGYARAKKDAAFERQVQANILQIALRRSEGRLVAIVNSNDRDLAQKVAAIRTWHQTIVQPAIEREIANDPHMADPAMRLSDGLLRQLNAARIGSTCTRRVDGGIECALPAAVADPGPDGGDAGAD